jgi:hypothetical protein
LGLAWISLILLLDFFVEIRIVLEPLLECLGPLDDSTAFSRASERVQDPTKQVVPENPNRHYEEASVIPDNEPLLFLFSQGPRQGLNLTAANCAFHLDPWWNPAVADPGGRPGALVVNAVPGGYTSPGRRRRL